MRNESKRAFSGLRKSSAAIRFCPDASEDHRHAGATGPFEWSRSLISVHGTVTCFISNIRYFRSSPILLLHSSRGPGAGTGLLRTLSGRCPNLSENIESWRPDDETLRRTGRAMCPSVQITARTLGEPDQGYGASPSGVGQWRPRGRSRRRQPHPFLPTRRIHNLVEFRYLDIPRRLSRLGRVEHRVAGRHVRDRVAAHGVSRHGCRP